MSDIALVWNPDEGRADLNILSAGDFDTDDGFETAILLSLFTNAEDDTQSDRQGWWADTTNDKFGSLLWRFARSKADRPTAQQLRDAAVNGLAWMVSDSVVQKVDASVELPTNGIVNLTVSIQRPGGDTLLYRYAFNWAAQLASIGG